MKQLLFLSAAVLLFWLSVCTAYTCPDGCVNGECEPYIGNLICQCYGNWSGPTCDEFICNSTNPCYNNGTCVQNPNDVSQYICACPLGFTGDRCQHKVPKPNSSSYCSSNPCYGNGTCYETNSKLGYFCDCNIGYFGPFCNFTVSTCLEALETYDEICSGRGYCLENANVDGEPQPGCGCNASYISNVGKGVGVEFACLPTFFCSPDCVNGTCEPIQSVDNEGNVITENNGFCSCDPGYSGDICNTTFDVCNGKCLNGGTCTPDGHYFNCSCPNGFTGEICEYFLDPCENLSCRNNGRCMPEVPPSPNGLYYTNNSGVVGASCECECGYQGEHCELPRDENDPCSFTPCGTGECNRDDSISGFTCTCPDGYAGDLCDQSDHCASSPCNPESTVDCVNFKDTFVCVCVDGWVGLLCGMDIDECLRKPSPCAEGNCSNFLGSYMCTCPPSWTGLRCDVAVACDNVQCENGGTCELREGMATCDCSQGFRGDRCEIEECPVSGCDQLAGNNLCDEICFTESCNFDGGDCFGRVQHPTPSPWANCSAKAVCRLLFSDGQCDIQCNTPGCLFDGFDCAPPSQCAQESTCLSRLDDGMCSPECNTLECPYDSKDCGDQDLARGLLVLYVVTNVGRPFVSPWREEFISDLSKITNSRLVLQSALRITREDLVGLHEPLMIFPPSRLSDGLWIYKVTFKLDLSYCRGNCPTTVEDAANLIQGTIDSGSGFIGPYGVAAAAASPDPSPDPGPDLPSPTATAIGSIVGVVVVAGVAVIVVIMILRKRQRSYESESTETKRVKGTLWRPGSPSEGISRSSPSTDGKKGSGGKSGSALVSKEVTPAPPEEPDRYIAEGSVRAGMEPRDEASPIKWGGVTKPIVSFDPSPNDDSRTVVGQVGHDKRQWTIAHSKALQDPMQVRSLVEKFREQNGLSSDVNARGPGGLTPLMLVIMKRHSSHESMMYSSSRGSSDSGSSDHNDHTAPLLPPNTRTPRGAYYPLGSQLSPIDSSVSALIDAKVNLDVTNDYGQAALHLACACSRGDYVEQLLEAGANPNIQDNWGQSALQAAIVAAAEGAFMLLVNHPRTDINLKSDGGVTPLIAAVKVVNQFMVNQLLKKNVDIGTTDKDGRTAVHWAAMVDNLEALKLLIRQGPDAIKDAQDSKGQTALFLACREGSALCVKHLLDCFANATLMDNLEQSPIQIAYRKQHMDIVDMLRSTTQGPFSMHSQAPPMRGVPNMSGGYPVASQYHEDMGQGPYSHQLVHPRKSKAKKGSSHARNGSVDLATPTYISNPAFFGVPQQTGERHQTFGDLSVSARSQQGPMPMRNFGPSHTSYTSTSESMPPANVHITSEYQKPPPISHGNNGYLHPITPPDSATLKVGTAPYPLTSPSSHMDPSSSIAITSTTAFDEIQAVSDLITSMADNPPAMSNNHYNRFPDKSTTVYPETSVGGAVRLQHYPLADHKHSYGSGPPPDVTRPSPPHSTENGSPSSGYPSPPHSNELPTQSFNGYQYPLSQACSPPSLTPSPESREEALARQQFHHDIEAYGTIIDSEHQGMGHVIQHHYQGYPLESSV